MSLATAHDIVVITAHDIGRHLRCYGVEGVVSPNMDSLATPHNDGVIGLAHSVASTGSSTRPRNTRPPSLPDWASWLGWAALRCGGKGLREPDSLAQ
jgi:hypothetical protein